MYIEGIDTIRSDVEHYKMRLRDGERGPLAGPRQTGRTQAFLEYAHELVHNLKTVVIIYQRHSQAKLNERRYRELFKCETVSTPVFLCRGQEDLTRGHSNLVILYDTD